MTEQHSPEVEIDENQLIAERQKKLALIRESEGPTFPNDFRRSHRAGELAAVHGHEEKEELAEQSIEVAVCGRIMLRRIMGKASFLTIQDVSGRIQLYARKADLPDGVYDDFKTWDLGDIVGGRGTLFKTNTGELSVHLTEIRLLTKSLRPLPDKHKGLTDTELRYRQRYVDLMTRAAFHAPASVRSGDPQNLFPGCPFPGRPRSVEAQVGAIEFDHRVLFHQGLAVHAAHLDDLTHDLGVKPVAFGLSINVADIRHQLGFFFFEAFDPFNILPQHFRGSGVTGLEGFCWHWSSFMGGAGSGGRVSGPRGSTD